MIKPGTLCIALAARHDEDDFAPYVGLFCTVVGYDSVRAMGGRVMDHICKFSDGECWLIARADLVPVSPPKVDSQTLRDRELAA